jgi:hypothetical protein
MFVGVALYEVVFMLQQTYCCIALVLRKNERVLMNNIMRRTGDRLGIMFDASSRCNFCDMHYKRQLYIWLN